MPYTYVMCRWGNVTESLAEMCLWWWLIVFGEFSAARRTPYQLALKNDWLTTSGNISTPSEWVAIGLYEFLCKA